MTMLLNVPVSSVITLSAERSLSVIRTIFRSECGYAKLSPKALTISERLTIADGGIDAEINVPTSFELPTDSLFQSGITGYQIKSGTSFKPWTQSAIRSELLDSNGNLGSELQRLVERSGRYVVLATGHDLTPEQRNDSCKLIAEIFADKGHTNYSDFIDVLGASQIVEFAERYPSTASMLSIDTIQEAWVLDEWQRDAHMSNIFEASSEQEQLIKHIRDGLLGDSKHIRILGEPGLGKTRLVLEAVKNPNIAPYVLYLQHGTKFGQTKLFRQLLKTGWSKPLVLVLDELPETEMSDIWRHLKPRCGDLKIISMDHGRDETSDDEIERLEATPLADNVIKKILLNRVGYEMEGLERWLPICEGSPRVAQAVADNLISNPDDILKSPTTVPIWDRFLHGYGARDVNTARQLDCVTQHLALFSRFGYEAPVSNEASYIAGIIEAVDPTIGWARYQEIIYSLRSKRVLQGSRTLFFVPKALHIYLWKQFWIRYGRGFDFVQMFNDMPVSLHAWFLNMFRYAGDAATEHILQDILKNDGIFSDRDFLTSDIGTKFLTTLAEANPSSVLKLLEFSFGALSDQEILEFKEHRQNIVWSLEKIAVWQPFTVRAIRLLALLASNENANHSNNATGTLLGLFKIGPEAAVTVSSAQERLPALLELLRSPNDGKRRLGLQAACAALNWKNIGYRIVGPEYQGLKERAKLWIPATYDDWWNQLLQYFQALVDETQSWPDILRGEVCQALINCVEWLIKIPQCTELAFKVLLSLVEDPAMSARLLNQFFIHCKESDDEDHSEINSRLQELARQYTRRNLVSRFQRYVVDVDWLEWEEDVRERRNKPKTRAKLLVESLAKRIAENPDTFNEIVHLLYPSIQSPALFHFGRHLGLYDKSRLLLPILKEITIESKHQVCIHGYLSMIQEIDNEIYHDWILTELSSKDSAWLGATITLRNDYEDTLFASCLNALEQGWIDPSLFFSLKYGKVIVEIPASRVTQLFQLLNSANTIESLHLIVELLDAFEFDVNLPCDSEFVFGIVQSTIPIEGHHDVMRGYHWRNVCKKLIRLAPALAIPLLDVLLTAMGQEYQLSYDSDVVEVTEELVLTDVDAAWVVVRNQFEITLPQWRTDLFSWLKGGLTNFDEKEIRGPISYFPMSEIIAWIEQDIGNRAALIAHAAPRSLDDEYGGDLTRELLYRYSDVEGVCSGISSTFQSGGWSGSTSSYLKRRREKFRQWLAAGFQQEVIDWIEAEIEYLDRSIEREEIQDERMRYD